MQNSKSGNNKNKRYTLLAWTLAILVFLLAIPVNLIFDRINFFFDMTSNNLYSLSDTTKDYLTELDAKGVTVDVYFLEKMEDLEGDLEVLALYRTLLAYDEHPCFNLIDFDPDTDPTTLRKINPENKFNLSSGDFLFVYGDMTKRLPGNLMYSYGTDDSGEVTKAEFRAENYFTGYMKTVVEGELPVVYFLEGHGETPISEMSRLTANLANYNYGAQSLNLTTAGSVPEDACILIIAGPQYDLTDAEFKAIYDYSEKGGNISLLMSPSEKSDVFPNLEQLMFTYNIGMHYDRVYETDPNRHSHDEPYAFLCDFAPASTETGEDLTGALIADSGSIPLYMPYSRSFETLVGSNYSACAIDSLIITQTTAYGEPYGGNVLDPQPSEGKELVLSMYSKDSLRENSKMVVFGSADIIKDSGVENAYFVMPLQLFLTTVTWMYNSDIDMNIANKERTFDSLSINSDSEATGLMAVFIGFPVVIAAAGVIVWLRRKDG